MKFRKRAEPRAEVSGDERLGQPTSSTAAVLRKLELDVKRRLDGVLHGDYAGLVPGHGSELGEARLYAPGDDVRRIDWNVTARTQQAHIRETIADRELETRVAIDLSPSLRFGTALSEKRDVALSALGAVGFLTDRVGNRFGAELITPSGIESIPARQGRSHVLSILDRVARQPGAESGGGDLAAGIARLDVGRQRRGLRVVISDFLGGNEWQPELRRVATRHETLAIEIVDPRELELPNVGTIVVRDPRTGRQRSVATGNAKVRQRFAEAARAQEAAIADAIRSAGAEHLVLRTDNDWLFDVVSFVAARKRRLVAAQ